MAKTKINRATVLKLARLYLDRHQPESYRIVIEPKGAEVDELGWWTIPISVTAKNAPTYDWVGRSVEASVD
jgi:hypothetical protein